MAAPILPPSLGKPVSSRQFSWKEMVIRQWGSEYAAPDHGVYQFSNGRRFDSTDLGSTGIYRQPGYQPPTPPRAPPWTADNANVTADNAGFRADGSFNPNPPNPPFTADNQSVTADNPQYTADGSI